jgi:PleD family two-component response regulator
VRDPRDPAITLADLMARADAALYQAKQNGRARLELAG